MSVNVAHPQQKRGDRIKKAILTPFVLVVAFIIIAFLGTAYTYQENGRKAALRHIAESSDELVHLLLDKDIGLMHAATDAIIANPRLREAMERGDREALTRWAQPIFNELRDHHRVSHLYFTAPDKSTLLRLRDPAHGDDLTEHATLLEAFNSGSSTSGIELRPQGTLILRMVVPWRYNGEVIGYLEMGQDMSQLAEEVHRVLDVDVLVMVHKDDLEREKWEDGVRQQGRQDSWDQLPSWVPVVQTMKSIPTALGLMMEAGTLPGRAVVNTESGRKVLNVAWLPLNDAQQQPVGNIALISDITGEQQSFMKSIPLVATLAVLACIGVFSWFLIRLDRAEHDLLRKQALEEHLIPLTAGRHPLELVALVHQVMNRYAENPAHPPIHTKLPGVPVAALLDPVLLSQSLLMLLTLASRDQGEDAPIELRLRLDPRPDEQDVWVLAITGLRHSTPSDGTAFSLDAARHMASLTGCDLTIETTPKGGSEWVLHLPMAVN